MGWGNGQSLGSAPASAPTTNSVQPLEPLLDNLLGMGFEMGISKRALVATQNVGLEQAIDWISEHQDDDFTPSETPSSDEPTPTRTEPQMSWEEREKILKEKIRQKKEEKNEQQREINRIKNASSSTMAKRAIEEQKRKDEVALMKRQKREEKEARAAIRAKIAAAKEDRLGQAGHVVPSSPSSSDTQPQTSAAPTKEYSECALAIRLPNGQAVKATFKPSDTLETVHQYLLQQSTGLPPNFALSTNYPRKAYRGDMLAQVTLSQAELVPRGALTATN